MKWGRGWVSYLTLCALVLPCPSLAAESDAVLQSSGTGVAEQGSKSPMETPAPSKATEPETPPLAVVPLAYKPPQRGALGSRVAPGGRGEGDKTSLLYALAPDDHIGLTAQEQPSLYWYLSALTNDGIELTIVDEQAIHPLFAGFLPPPTRVGIQQIRLADYGIRLPLDVQYKWFVSVVPDPNHRSKDSVIGGGIQHIELPETLHAQLTRAKKGEIPALYAEAGLWYDALMAITELIDAAPSETSFRAQHASLLEQVGLREVAAHER